MTCVSCGVHHTGLSCVSVVAVYTTLLLTFCVFILPSSYILCVSTTKQLHSMCVHYENITFDVRIFPSMWHNQAITYHVCALHISYELCVYATM